MNWIEIMPSLAELDIVVGTPVRMRPGHVPTSWSERDGQTLTVRPCNGYEETHCMVIDNQGTSMPVPLEAVTIDLEHPLGLAAAMMVMGHHYLRVKSYALCSPSYDMLNEIRIILAGDIQKKMQIENTNTHREV